MSQSTVSTVKNGSTVIQGNQNHIFNLTVQLSGRETDVEIFRQILNFLKAENSNPPSNFKVAPALVAKLSQNPHPLSTALVTDGAPAQVTGNGISNGSLVPKRQSGLSPEGILLAEPSSSSIFPKNGPDPSTINDDTKLPLITDSTPPPPPPPTGNCGVEDEKVLKQLIQAYEKSVLCQLDQITMDFFCTTGKDILAIIIHTAKGQATDSIPMTSEFYGLVMEKFDQISSSNLEPVCQFLEREVVGPFEKLFDDNICFFFEQFEQLFTDARELVLAKIPVTLSNQNFRTLVQTKIYEFTASYEERNRLIVEIEVETAVAILRVAAQHYKNEMDFFLGQEFCYTAPQFGVHQTQIRNEAIEILVSAGNFKNPQWRHWYLNILDNDLDTQEKIMWAQNLERIQWLDKKRQSVVHRFSQTYIENILQMLLNFEQILTLSDPTERGQLLSHRVKFELVEKDARHEVVTSLKKECRWQPAHFVQLSVDQLIEILDEKFQAKLLQFDKEEENDT